MAAVRPGNPPWKDAANWAADKQAERPGTSHFVIRDAEGNALSMTSSIETGFGSRIMVRGFLLNNELTDFSFVPERDGLPVANRVEGGKRPRSSMAPTIVFEGDEPYLLIGSPGGSPHHQLRGQDHRRGVGLEDGYPDGDRSRAFRQPERPRPTWRKAAKRRRWRARYRRSATASRCATSTADCMAS